MGCKYGYYMGDRAGVYDMTFKQRFLMTFCVCAVTSVGAALNVHAAPSVSSGDAAVSVSVSGGDAVLPVTGVSSAVPVADDGIVLYSSYDAYYGSISSTYLEYMRGYLPKLTPQAHYVGARVGQYDYLFAYGDELQWNGSSFSGAVTVIRWNTYNNGSFTSVRDGNFSLSPGSYLVYSDLSDKYPSLATSSDFTLRQILIAFTVFCLCLTVNTMYQVRRVRRTARQKEGDL